MAAQKNVLLVGAPGVGKTRLAREAARAPVEPVLVTGRDGLTYERLTAYYTVTNGVLRLELGELSKAIVSSWLLLSLGVGPRHLVIDEINRCNADVLLGEAFTAMDIAYRASMPVLRGEACRLVAEMLERLSKGDSEPARLLGIESYIGDVNGLRQAAERLLSIFTGIDGVPFPYSFRILATMNIYDRANLYTVGWALQRRFATLYVVAPYEKLRPKLDEQELKRLERSLLHNEVLGLLRDNGSSVYEQAVRELLAASRLGRSLVEEDNPTAPLEVDEDSIDEAVKHVPREYDNILKLIAYLYHVARVLRVELGITPLVDALKLLILYRASGMKALSLDELADLLLSTLILPLLGVATPRIRSELLLVGPDASRGYQAIRELRNNLTRVLGSETLSLRVVESYDLPYITAS